MSGEFEFSIPTAQRHDLVNVTGELDQAIREGGVKTGIACVMVPHTTCALILNEDEPGLREDILRHRARNAMPSVRPTTSSAQKNP